MPCLRAVFSQWSGGLVEHKKLTANTESFCFFTRESVNLETTQHLQKICFPAQTGINSNLKKKRKKDNVNYTDRVVGVHQLCKTVLKSRVCVCKH